MVSPTVTLVYNIFYFPSIRPVCDLRDDFSASKGGRNNLARLKRKNTLTSGEEDFALHSRQNAGIDTTGTGDYLCGKIQSTAGCTAAESDKWKYIKKE